MTRERAKWVRGGLIALAVMLFPGAVGQAEAPTVVPDCGGLRIPSGAVIDKDRSRGPVTVYGYSKKGFAEVASQTERLVKADGWSVQRDDQSNSHTGRVVLHLERRKVKAIVRVAGLRGRGMCGLIVTRVPK
jgi:hypothetical protein